jgi:hypothetical protein
VYRAYVLGHHTWFARPPFQVGGHLGSQCGRFSSCIEEMLLLGCQPLLQQSDFVHRVVELRFQAPTSGTLNRV